MCLGYAVDAFTGTCEPCNGTVAVFCGDGYRVQIDCATVGLQCHPLTGCTESTMPIECMLATFTGACTSTGRPQYCDGTMVQTGPVCADLGAVCDAGRCVGDGEACDNSATRPEGRTYFEGTACEGQTLVACVEGRLQRRDCTTVNPEFSCQSYGGEFFCGLGSECIPGNNPPGSFGTAERCEGTELIFCNAGRVERFDCTELGFTGCDVDAEFGCTPGILPEAG
jgi:hypothetical protein